MTLLALVAIAAADPADPAPLTEPAPVEAPVALPGTAATEAPAEGVDPTRLLGPPAGPPLEGAALEKQTHEAAKLLRCVVCQGLSVADSPSDTARAMRSEVEALAAKGYDTEQILFYFEASYGEFVRLEPKKEGFTTLVWVLPLAFLGIGGGLVSWIVASRRTTQQTTARRTVAMSPAAAALADDDPWLQRVRRETRGTEGA